MTEEELSEIQAAAICSKHVVIQLMELLTDKGIISREEGTKIFQELHKKQLTEGLK